nr:MAG TPA: hypothetical protein [Caudoviricetes sp.]
MYLSCNTYIVGLLAPLLFNITAGLLNILLSL